VNTSKTVLAIRNVRSWIHLVILQAHLLQARKIFSRAGSLCAAGRAVCPKDIFFIVPGIAPLLNATSLEDQVEKLRILYIATVLSGIGVQIEIFFM
jgi:hypothetical protein